MLIRSHRWRIKPPFGSAEIDWANPLTRGLVAGIVLNERAGARIHNLARPLNPGSAVDPLWSVHPVGMDVFNFNAVADRRITIPHEAALNVGGDLTIVARVTVQSTSADQTICTKGTGAFELDISGTSLRFNKAGLSVIATATIAASLTALRHFAATMVGNDAVTIYVDGASAGNASGTTLVDTSTELSIGGVSGSKILRGQMAEFWLWNRALSVSELATTYREPYAILKPRVRRVYTFVGAGGAGEISPGVGALVFAGQSPRLDYAILMPDEP